MDQWYLDIVKYAPEMLQELDNLNQWPNAVKESQRGWIGQTKGKYICGDLSNGTKLNVFASEEDLDRLQHAKFLSICTDISDQKRKQFLTENQENDFGKQDFRW